MKSENERPRLLVRKSLRGFTIQVINPDGKVVAGSWATKKDMIETAKKIAQHAIKQKVKQVRFDRGNHPYHGNIKKIADSARAAGLEF